MDNRTIEQVRDNETKLIKEIEVLETQLKKQREIINKAIEYIKSKDICIDIRKTDGSLECVSTNELLRLLEDTEETDINVGEV